MARTLPPTIDGITVVDLELGAGKTVTTLQGAWDWIYTNYPNLVSANRIVRVLVTGEIVRTTEGAITIGGSITTDSTRYIMFTAAAGDSVCDGNASSTPIRYTTAKARFVSTTNPSAQPFLIPTTVTGKVVVEALQFRKDVFGDGQMIDCPASVDLYTRSNIFYDNKNGFGIDCIRYRRSIHSFNDVFLFDSTSSSYPSAYTAITETTGSYVSRIHNPTLLSSSTILVGGFGSLGNESTAAGSLFCNGIHMGGGTIGYGTPWNATNNASCSDDGFLAGANAVMNIVIANTVESNTNGSLDARMKATADNALRNNGYDNLTENPIDFFYRNRASTGINRGAFDTDASGAPEPTIEVTSMEASGPDLVVSYDFTSEGSSPGIVLILERDGDEISPIASSSVDGTLVVSNPGPGVYSIVELEITDSAGTGSDSSWVGTVEILDLSGSGTGGIVEISTGEFRLTNPGPGVYELISFKIQDSEGEATDTSWSDTVEISGNPVSELTYSSALASTLTEATSKAGWCASVVAAIGSSPKLVARQSGTPRVTVQYSGALQPVDNAFVLGNDYSSLTLASGDNHLLTWRMESSDGTVWVEFSSPLNLVGNLDSDRALIFNQAVTIRPPASLPDGEAAELNWSSITSPLIIGLGGSYDLSQNITYTGSGPLTYSSIGASLSGTGISLNSSTGVLSVSGGASEGSVTGIQIRATDGTVLSDSSVFTVSKQSISLALSIPNLVVSRKDKVNLLSYVTYSGDTDDLTFSEVTSKLGNYLYIQNLASQKRLWVAANSPEMALTGVTIQVTDGVNTAQSTFNLTMVANDDVLWWDGITSTLVRSRTSYLDLREYLAYHASGTLTYSNIGASLPAGCTLNTSTGRITITAASVATTSGLRFRVTDGTSTEDSPIFSLQIVDEVLLQKDNFTWAGAFRVPTPPGIDGDVGTFSYGGMFSCIDEAGNSGNGSIYMYGIDTAPYMGEITIPTPGTSTTDTSLLPRATMLQPMTDGTEGWFATRDLTQLQGAHVVGNDLIMTAFRWYGDSSAEPTHMVRPKNLSVTGQLAGPKLCVVSNYVDDGIGWLGSGSPWTSRSFGGYTCNIPAAWQSALGGSIMSGISGMSTVASTTNGPALYSFNRSDMDSTNPKINGLVAYPIAESLAKRMGVVHQETDWLASGSRFWSYSATLRGVIFPEGSDSVIFIGTAADGLYWYGQRGPAPYPDNEYPWGYTPNYGSQGGHSIPGRWFMWGYRAADLAAVHAHTKLHYEIVPYAVWDLELPAYGKEAEINNGGARTIAGAAYRESTNQAYVSVRNIEGDRPIVHVLDVTF